MTDREAVFLALCMAVEREEAGVQADPAYRHIGRQHLAAFRRVIRRRYPKEWEALKRSAPQLERVVRFADIQAKNGEGTALGEGDA